MCVWALCVWITHGRLCVCVETKLQHRYLFNASYVPGPRPYVCLLVDLPCLLSFYRKRNQDLKEQFNKLSAVFPGAGLAFESRGSLTLDPAFWDLFVHLLSTKSGAPLKECVDPAPQMCGSYCGWRLKLQKLVTNPSLFSWNWALCHQGLKFLCPSLLLFPKSGKSQPRP